MSSQIATNSSAQLYLDRGELYREDRNWEAAEADYTRAAELEPRLAAVDFCRANLLADRGQLGAARELFDKVILRSPSDGKALIARARILVRMEQRKLALADFEHGLELMAEPGPECFLEWAQALSAEGQVSEALRSLDRGIAKFGPINALQVYAMDLELGRKNTDAALARLETIIEQAPRKELWLARRGDIQLSAGRSVEARQSYNAAVAAIKLLPRRLQQNTPMLNLESRISSVLDEMGTVRQTAKVVTN